jgi:hypothetical protein
MCFLLFIQILSETFLILKRNERDLIKMCIGLHVKYLLFWSGFNETWIFPTHFQKKYTNIKFYENPSRGSRVVPCGLTDGRTGVTKTIVTFRNFANWPKNYWEHSAYILKRHVSIKGRIQLFRRHNIGTVGLLVNNESERIWKEAVVV